MAIATATKPRSHPDILNTRFIIGALQPMRPHSVLALLELLGGHQRRNQEREHAEGDDRDPEADAGTRLDLR